VYWRAICQDSIQFLIAMASSDLDPAFQKALVLLHSKSKDSAEQMKALLEDFLRLKTGKEVKVKLPVNPPAKLVITLFKIWRYPILK